MKCIFVLSSFSDLAERYRYAFDRPLRSSITQQSAASLAQLTATAVMAAAREIRAGARRRQLTIASISSSA
jgi:hypothetical protein